MIAWSHDMCRVNLVKFKVQFDQNGGFVYQLLVLSAPCLPAREVLKMQPCWMDACTVFWKVGPWGLELEFDSNLAWNLKIKEQSTDYKRPLSSHTVTAVSPGSGLIRSGMRHHPSARARLQVQLQSQSQVIGNPRPSQVNYSVQFRLSNPT
jgi:hypothetical protein